MNGSDAPPPKAPVEQLREVLARLVPQLQPDVEPAVVFTFEADDEEVERR
jgi:hypothetical protein